MKKTANIIMLILGAMGASTFATANSSIPFFVKETSPKNATFNCALRGQVKTQKCSVHQVSKVHNSESAILTSLIGRNSNYELLSIRWPEGHTNQYAILPNMQVVNLANNRILNLKVDPTNKNILDLTNGLVIQQNGEEHARLW